MFLQFYIQIVNFYLQIYFFLHYYTFQSLHSNNFQNFWNPLLEQFKSINENKFGNINLQSIFETIDTPQQFEKILKSWQK